MFKKRSRPTSVRDKPTERAVDESEEKDVVPTEGDEATGQSIEELIMMRKLRKSKQGIDIERLNRGDNGRKGKKKEPDIDYTKFGLQSSRRTDGDNEHNEEFEDDQERAKRLVRTNKFSQQTNALDVDKHMLAYIESEMEKRRGQAALDAKNGKVEPFDPQAELYKVAERYKVEAQKQKEDEEGNVTNSLGMLTSIPEVDLGMDNRLKNIEQTEKAKREMMEQRKAATAAAVRKRPEDEDFAAARFFKPNHRVASDIYAIEDAKREAAGLPTSGPPPRTDRISHESATDEQVYDRFKKRMKR